MENVSIFKNPSSQDLIFIEDLEKNYHLEDACLDHLPEENRKIIEFARDSKERSAFKSLFEKYFPYTKKLWEIIFLLINQKITNEELAQAIQEKLNIPQDICASISQDIINNSTVQQEITAIQIEEDIIPPEENYNQEEDFESADEEFIDKIEEEIAKENPDNASPKKGGGLGQELL
jgi:hypothetical protein